MAKPAPKTGKKPLKELKKELEDRLFGEKNKAKKKEIQTMIKKIEMEMDAERKLAKEKEDSKKVKVKQLIPVGVDPKSVLCINFQNKTCDLGDGCQFSHEPLKTPKKEIEDLSAPKIKLVCRFLIDALNNGQYVASWKCPNPNCKDIHKLTEVSSNKDVEISLEEYIELQRQNMNTKLTPVTEETFAAWKERKLKEEEKHALRVAALSLNAKGTDLFKNKPEIFDDDEEAVDDDIDYKNREYSLSSEEE